MDSLTTKIQKLPDDLMRNIFLYIPDRLPFKDELLEKQKQKENEERDIEFRRWVCETFNSTLPQHQHYYEEFDEYMTIAEGGIYDSEWMRYVHEDEPSDRIVDFIQFLLNLPD